jgi:hypothetical protein
VSTHADSAERFLALHHGDEPFLMPNAWDRGSARLLASLGFPALATTSSGFAATLGRLDGSVTREEALALLRRNSAAAADAIRALSDEELDRAAPASLYGDAPVTSQFVLEDHAVRHSYHHLARIRGALGA